MKIHVIHGIHTEPDSPVKGLLPLLRDQGFHVCYPEYGYELALETRMINPIVEGVLKPYVYPDDFLIGHSNGCAIAYHLLKQGLVVRGAVFINGALEQAIERPVTCGFIDVYFNSGDRITEVAKLGEKVGIVDDVWGELGHGGYQGNDPWITNFDCGQTVGMPIVQGHSDFFTQAKLDKWGRFLAQRLKTSLGSRPEVQGA